MFESAAFSAVADHFRRYVRHEHLGVDEYEIEEALAAWLPMIQAPNNLRGLGIVFRNLHAFHTEASLWQEIAHLFKLPSWFLPALGYEINCQDKPLLSLLMDGHMAKGWCQDAPFYAWLFRAVEYFDSYNARQVQLLFIRCYYDRVSLLTDPSLATSSKSREEEVCSAARLLLDKSNWDMQQLIAQVEDQHLTRAEKLADFIDAYCRDNKANIENKNANYLRSLVHFFYADWTQGSRRQRNLRQIEFVHRRYNKTRRFPIQGSATLLELLPSIDDELDNDGLDPDDLFAAQLYVQDTVETSVSIRKKLTPNVARIFDPQLQKKRAIDVTAKVRRGQNVALQNSELLSQSQLAGFIRYLFKLERSSKAEARQFALAAWCMLYLGKDFVSLRHLHVFDDLQQATAGLYLDPQGEGWWHFPINYSAKPRMDDQVLGLSHTRSEVMTPCPDFLTTRLCHDFAGGSQPLLSTGIHAEVFHSRLKHYSDRLIEGARVNADKLAHFTQRFIFATHCVDPVVLDFSFQTVLTQTRVSRSYANLSDSYRLAALQTLWAQISEYIHEVDPALKLPVLFELRPWHELQQVGSIFTPTQSACVALTASLKQKLHEATLPAAFSLDQLVQYHNAYARYTAYFVSFATGYRAVHNPMPTLALFLREYGLLGISDKDDSDFTHARYVCVPDELKQHLGHYQRHLRQLAELIRYRFPELGNELDGMLQLEARAVTLEPSEAANWYKRVKNSRQLLGPLFHFRKIHNQWTAVNLSPAVLVAEQPAGIRLPANAGRHWLKTRLLAERVDPELIDWQMGHWMTGQAPMGYYSIFNHVENRERLAPTLDRLLQEVGWLALNSLIS